MIVIATSETLADLLPEICYVIDPDLPYSDDLPQLVRSFVRRLILHAFYVAIREDLQHHVEWLSRIRHDSTLAGLIQSRSFDVEVVDADGTYTLLLEDPRDDY